MLYLKNKMYETRILHEIRSLREAEQRTDPSYKEAAGQAVQAIDTNAAGYLAALELSDTSELTGQARTFAIILQIVLFVLTVATMAVFVMLLFAGLDKLNAGKNGIINAAKGIVVTIAVLLMVFLLILVVAAFKMSSVFGAYVLPLIFIVLMLMVLAFILNAKLKDVKTKSAGGNLDKKSLSKTKWFGFGLFATAAALLSAVMIYTYAYAPSHKLSGGFLSRSFAIMAGNTGAMSAATEWRAPPG